MRISILKAGKGDSLLLSWEDNHMLIDSGTPSTLRKNRNTFLPSTQDIEYYLLTHIDFDHIGGFIDLLSKTKKQYLHPSLIFFGNTLDLIKYKNNDKVGYHHGSLLTDLTSNLGIKTKSLHAGNTLKLKGLLITVLSPLVEHLDILIKKWSEAEKEYNKIQRSDDFVSVNQKVINIDEKKVLPEYSKSPENDILNATSIAFLAEYNNKKILILGDAHSEIILEQLEKIVSEEDEKK
ncbi:hypothetical protein J7315_21880 [Providencia rettgeri]|uniref:MBL fold metallo-hydrolase n=1 Tax=Providencia rettgeri TaxID=587 RepID=UPI001B371F92|nr:MBL fold metallo-hydrolase [Providencia rettgeri]MBQ0688702.1 hypothetical protein [Providencia rettgeri]